MRSVFLAERGRQAPPRDMAIQCHGAPARTEQPRQSRPCHQSSRDERSVGFYFRLDGQLDGVEGPVSQLSYGDLPHDRAHDRSGRTAHLLSRGMRRPMLLATASTVALAALSPWIVDSCSGKGSCPRQGSSSCCWSHRFRPRCVTSWCGRCAAFARPRQGLSLRRLPAGRCVLLAAPLALAFGLAGIAWATCVANAWRSLTSPYTFAAGCACRFATGGTRQAHGVSK